MLASEEAGGGSRINARQRPQQQQTTTSNPRAGGSLTSRARSSSSAADSGCATAADCRGTIASWPTPATTTGERAARDTEEAGAPAADVSAAWDPRVDTPVKSRLSVARGGSADGDGGGGGVSERRPSPAPPAVSSLSLKPGHSHGVADKAGVRLPVTEAGAALQGPPWRASAATAGGGGDDDRFGAAPSDGLI